MIRLWLLASLLSLVPGTGGQSLERGARSPGSGTRSPEALHDTHVSHTRLVIEGRTIALRVRLFHDDLTLALRAATRNAALELTPQARADPVFEGYFRDRVKLEVDGRPVELRVTGSGMEEDAAAQQVVWYVLEGGLERPASRIVIMDGLLFEAFRDQQNIVQLLKLPEDNRRTFYFTASDPRDQQLVLPPVH